MAIISLAGFGQTSDLEGAREAGFNDYLINPIDLAALREILDKIPQR